jgi:hypothetical protein
MAALRPLWRNLTTIALDLPHLSLRSVCPLIFFYSIFLVLVSYPVGVSSISNLVTVPGREKEVGYVSAPNWTWAFILLFPLLTFFLLESFRCVPEVLRTLGARGMLVDLSLTRIDSNTPVTDWKIALEKAKNVFAGLILIALMEPLIEWLYTSARPLLWCGIKCVPEKEFDWSIGALLKGSGLGVG